MTINPCLFIIFLFLTSSLFALLEIQIEGKDGWAANLPTWKISKKLNGIFKTFIDPDKPITGYHTYLWIFLLLLVHFPFLITSWSIQKEYFILSYYWLMLSLEDFLWFVYNPSYGIKKFSSKYIKWHTVWLLGLPIQYWIKFPLGILLYYLAIV